MSSRNTPATRLATRLAFLISGFSFACWAPLVPLAKERLAVNDAQLGLLLLCIGVGSVPAMLFTGPLAARYGSRPIILAGGLLAAATLPALAIAPTPMLLGAALLLFGGSLGSIDVAMNVHALEVEQAASTPLMSGFHALFSVGGFAGAALMTFLLSRGIDALTGTLLSAGLVAAAMVVAWPRLLQATAPQETPLFAVPRGIVALLAFLTCCTFLIEGAMLDWSALLLVEAGLASKEQGGLGFAFFSIAMTAGRLGGDALIARIGIFAVLRWGGVLAFAGFVVLLTSQVQAAVWGGFLMIGLGASNIVPILFSRAGSQNVMPAALAVGAITTMGYAGVLVGPAAIGLVAQVIGLQAAFWALAVLLLAVPLTARFAARP